MFKFTYNGKSRDYPDRVERYEWSIWHNSVVVGLISQRTDSSFCETRSISPIVINHQQACIIEFGRWADEVGSGVYSK